MVGESVVTTVVAVIVVVGLIVEVKIVIMI